MMNQIKTELDEIKLVGIACRASNEKAFQSDPASNPIAHTVQNYFHNGLAEKIQHRKKPGTTYCVYTDYENDHHGEYTYFIGEAVESFDDIPEGYETLTIPAQDYIKYTNNPGPMPAVCIDMWQNIWQKSPADLGGERSYVADFEVYDERSADHNNVVLDIYIGINS